MPTLTDTVPTPAGQVMVITKTSHLLFFTKPRTSIMPQGLSEFGRRLGFQAVYRTTDPQILEQLHHLWVAVILAGGFEAYLAGAKMGFVDFPPEYSHLRSHIVGFHG